MNFKEEKKSYTPIHKDIPSSFIFDVLIRRFIPIITVFDESKYSITDKLYL